MCALAGDGGLTADVDLTKLKSSAAPSSHFVRCFPKRDGVGHFTYHYSVGQKGGLSLFFMPLPVSFNIWFKLSA